MRFTRDAPSRSDVGGELGDLIGRRFVAKANRYLTFHGIVGAVIDNGRKTLVVPANVDAGPWGSGFDLRDVTFPGGA